MPQAKSSKVLVEVGSEELELISFSVVGDELVGGI